MATVTYFLNSGTPGNITGNGVGGVTLKEALKNFKEYQEECDKYGNEWKDATMEIVFDIPSYEAERIYGYGMRGGIVRID